MSCRTVARCQNLLNLLMPVRTAPWGRTVRAGWPLWLWLLVANLVVGPIREPGVVAADALPRLIVPGHEREMRLLEALFARHHSPRVGCTLWDAWLPMSTLWPAVGDELSAEPLRQFYRQSFLGRPIDAEGYVSMMQHRGLAHPAGWPFPTWPQAGGVGWHFTYAGSAYSRRFGPPVASAENWQLERATGRSIDMARGWRLELREPRAMVVSPRFEVDAFVAPFVVIEVDRQRLPASARPWLEWTTADGPQFSKQRRIDLPREAARTVGRLSLLAVPLYRHPGWQGTITRLRIGWDNPGPAGLDIAAIYTAIDSRHPITGPLFVRGSCDYFHWTGDVDFLRRNLPRMRRALTYTLREFDVDQQGCVRVPWVGHDGRAGFTIEADGSKRILPGHGVGNNYWDLLPFGHRDCLATVYLFDALRHMAAVERHVAAHPQWQIDPPPAALKPAVLSALAERLRRRAGRMFWNADTGRFVACIDADGRSHDYGFTFLNLEAIHYGFATEEQARDILDWITGKRLVATDTAQGADIYHWRFGPRSTTRRNIDWYVWVWSQPETIAWGDQVQDGGAVLGFSYFDLMARLKVLGPDNAWARLRELLDWFAAVEQAGGYRKYYADGRRGTLQGGGTAGGLGLDQEFFESLLVPQVMLYGFLGVRPRGDGLAIDPRLPSDWPSLTITRVQVLDQVLDITARNNGSLRFVCRRVGQRPLRIRLPEGGWKRSSGPAELDGRDATLRFSSPGQVVELTSS